MNVLIVDDEPDLIEVLLSWFSKENKHFKQVVTVDNIMKAKTMLDRGEFDILLTDFAIGKEEGTELVKYCRAHEKLKKISIIIMSGVVSKDVTISYQNIHFISKPFAQNELINLVIEVDKRNSESRKKIKIDPQIIQALSDTTRDVITSFIREKIEILPQEEQISRTPLKGDLSAVMSIDCNKFRGSFNLTFTKNCILNITSSMLFEKFNEVNDDVIEATAELTNIIIGNAKAKLSDYKFVLAAPTVIYGQDYQILHLDGSYSVKIPFKSPFGNFFFDIRILPNSIFNMRS